MDERSRNADANPPPQQKLATDPAKWLRLQISEAALTREPVHERALRDDQPVDDNCLSRAEGRACRLFCPAHRADGFSSFSKQLPRPTRVAGKRVLKAAATRPERPAELRDRSLRSL